MIIKDEEKEKRIKEIFSDKDIRIISMDDSLKEWVYKNIDDLYDYEITKSNYVSYLRKDAFCSRNIKTLAYLARKLYTELDKNYLNDMDALRALSAVSCISKTYYRILKEQSARETGVTTEELFPNSGMNEYAMRRFYISSEQNDENVRIYRNKKACN